MYFACEILSRACCRMRYEVQGLRVDIMFCVVYRRFENELLCLLGQ